MEIGFVAIAKRVLNKLVCREKYFYNEKEQDLRRQMRTRRRVAHLVLF